MNEWKEFKKWKEQKPEDLEECGEVIPEGERPEHVKQGCNHSSAIVRMYRDDGLKDCYCSECNIGGICRSLEEFKTA